MTPVHLRHHHLVCMQNFVGKGYDDDFVANMKLVIDKLALPEAVIRLSIRCDDICAHCPNRKGSECQDELSVIGKDRSVAHFLGLAEEEDLKASDLMAEVRGRMLQLDDIRSLCGRCDWADLCNDRLKVLREGR